ncbi:MAG: hypothetical protein VXW00_07350 [Candidatus Latescibacterota bacterium]|nr:hypothetical protein [Candidatus Latescibacterota bacterium]MEE2727573.1 hypothetical protein [Candidatus Latescibacterota bacterium]
MLKTFLRAFVVFHLESRMPTLTPGAVWAYWRSRPTIHFVLDQTRTARSSQIKRSLDRVYPF